ncbi:MAG TPA: acyltransferase [Mycobacteriales bacterium]|nr:acyltransferase [Mycobacteriales bacterium]HWC34606.1 acyltransferase [Mycobacteriales bacterium]
MTKAGRLTYRPEIDGVRAIAVLAVLGFHVSFVAPALRPYFGGGFLGVDIFFVLSGMLITELIVADHLATNQARLRDFYRRRARRLLPALVTFLVLAAAYFQLDRNAGISTLKNYVSVFTFVDAGHMTYPWSVGVSQIWTLIVEWEFYIFWPLALIIALRRGVDRRRIGMWTAVAAVAMTGVRLSIYLLGTHNWNLSYYSGWLRFDELLVGCALGLLSGWPQVPNWLRVAGGAFLLYVIGQARFSSEWLYVGGMLAIATCAAMVVQPRAKPWAVDRVLASAPMVWMGKLSYSLYLWSGTLVAEVSVHGRSWSSTQRAIVSIIGSFALAIPSYYLVERRFRLPSRRAAGGETDPVRAGVHGSDPVVEAEIADDTQATTQ